ncbi:N-acetylneuraminate synthase family protein [Hungatella hathewayi]|uniref:N-acetylneuraminate synthase family protein n=1 Tax=Hungatella hathewayi TaxID=154046 RepID=UPI0035623EC7
MAKTFCQADVVKFQKRNVKEFLTREQYNAPHPVPENAYGPTYGAHREYLEFSVDQHRILKEYCDSIGIVYSTSVWDLSSAKEIAGLNPQMIKIPSASNNHYEMLNWLCENYGGEIHVSLGMTTRAEEERLVKLFERNGRLKDLVLYACTSGYPVPFKDVAMLEIKRLYDTYGGLIKDIGFSGHHNGKSIDVAAYALGAGIIERHYTLDRTWKGTDHAASLEPEGVRRLRLNLNYTYEAMHYKQEEILPIEQAQREKLKYREHRDCD